MEELLVGVNLTAVLVSFILSFLLGCLWINPKLFGTKWANGVPGVSLDSNYKPPALAMITQALGVLGLAWLFGISAFHVTAVTMILIVITIILLVVSNGKFANKSNAAVTVEAAYIIAMSIIMYTCQLIL